MKQQLRWSLRLLVATASLMLANFASAAECNPWSAGTVYTQGLYSTHVGKTWRAKWYTQNEAPGSSQWGPWEERPASECSVVIPPGGDGSGIPEPTPTVGKHLGSYFAQWGIYGRNYKLRNLVDTGNDKKLTFLNYAFGNIYADGKCNIITKAENGNGDGGDGWADYQRGFAANESVDGVGDSWDAKLKGNFNQLKKLKLRNPNLKVLISLGGWTWSKNFSKFSMTDASRKALVTSCINLYVNGNLPSAEGAGGAGVAKGVFDGFDIDWEYPVAGGLPTNTYNAADKQNFTLLLAEFRAQLDALATSNKRKYYLTVAIGAGADKIRNTEPGLYSKHLDWVNVMTYDFHGGWEATGPTNFQSNLYRDPAAPVTGDLIKYNVDDAVTALIAGGIPKAKIVVGIPFYGRGWKGVAAGPKGDGLYQSASSPAAGTYEAGIEDYKVLVQKRATRYTHAVTKQLWTYDGNEFWSYDDPSVISTKSSYVKTQGLGGLFSWSLDGDDAQGNLLKAMTAVRQ
ncbi:glycosyl hydrolase family 18 protein [Undibacterium flavidum]|uniref:chitinase n=1 Tax=Undibacterium flavidum TaxID=2762297 RepID=A0ABR6Y6Y8_9BURK|nr:glycosyl hydrolase family 18 protein [Undibacterium flavidum]MBC3872373.1 chitinase [Undibacterium flavidum]